MRQRPRSVTVVGWLCIAMGVVAVGYHTTELTAPNPMQNDVLWVLFVRALLIVGGVFLLRGHNWARWLLLAWLAFHVYISALHSLEAVVIHSFLLLAVGYFLLRAPASAFFCGDHS
jgi:hypothetical protein